MKTIKLTQGEVAFVDDEDFKKTKSLRWSVLKKNNVNSKYAQSNFWINGKRTTKFMHSFILGFPNSEIDHKNGNGLDNRKSNLRICTRKQNCRNTRVYKNKKFKGISFDSRERYKNNPWRSRITFDGKCIYLGNFKTQKEAAIAYDEMAKKIDPEFSKINGLKNENHKSATRN